jgi:UDP-glucose 4-epimerase
MENKSDTPIVVAGGAGFLGQNVVKYLMEKGRQCVIVDQKEPGMPDLRKAVEAEKIGLVVIDLTDRSAVETAVKRLPPRFHLANLAAVIDGTTKVSLESNMALQYHSGAAMNMAGSWRDSIVSICYTSSWEVYGVPDKLPLTETHEIKTFNVYGACKHLAENYLRTFCNASKIPLTILRLSHIYGPGEWHNKAIPNFIKNCIEGRPHKLFGGGQDLRDLVNTRDIANAIFLSLERTTEGIFNIAGGRCLNIRQILDIIQTVIGTDLPIEEYPADRPPIDLCFDLRHAKQELAWEPQVTMEDGIREEYEWFRSARIF